MDQELRLAPHPHHLGPPRCSAGGGARAVWHFPSRLWLSHCSTIRLFQVGCEIAFSSVVRTHNSSVVFSQLTSTANHHGALFRAVDNEGFLHGLRRTVGHHMPIGHHCRVFFTLKIVDTKVRQTLTPPLPLSGHRLPPRGLPWSGLGRREQPRGAAGVAGGASSRTYGLGVGSPQKHLRASLFF